MSAFLASQILVGIAFLTDFVSFQFKDRKKILLFLCVSAALISAHYFLLGRNTAGLLVSISILRFVTSYFSTRKVWMFSILGVTLLGFVYTYASSLSFLILIALMLITIGAFQKEDKYLRILMMGGTILVIVYNAIIFSPMAVLLEGSFFVSNLIGYYRFYIRGKN